VRVAGVVLLPCAAATTATASTGHAPVAGAHAAATIDLGCPSPPGAPGRQSLILKVTHWCGLSAPRKQWQIKIQLRITNTGRNALPIGLEHVMLAVSRFSMARWSPPRQPAERPFRAMYQGQRVWLIPANPDAAAEPFPPPKGNYTFATHWGAPATVAPGHTFHPSFRRGDAVFYVPKQRTSRRHHPELSGVVGIAYVDGPDVIDICPPDHWPAKTPAQSF
jgi:hypothetical protein